MPMVSAPPGRLSTTTDCPSWRASSGATRRVTLSVALPAACGTTKRIGRSGYSAAAVAAKKKASRENQRAMVFPASSLRRELRAHFAALVAVAVHVDIQVARLERIHLRRGELAPVRHGIGVAALGERNDHRTVLALGALVDVRHRALHALGADAAADRAVLGDAEAARALAVALRGRHFLGTGEVHLHGAASRHPVGHLVAHPGTSR